MTIVKTLAEYQALNLPESRGFIPTLGALHEGHMSLIEPSLQQNDCTVVSIYLNPTQFNKESDLESYPSTLSEDVEKLKQAHVDVLFLPDYQTVYPDNFAFRVTEENLSHRFCGKFRPGHFDGVLTVVLKLLNIIKPTKAYFGEKDYQQLRLIERMCDALYLSTEIVACPTYREESGLAYSSRNALLPLDLRLNVAPLLYQTLLTNQTLEMKQKALEEMGFEVEYLEEYEGRILAAANLSGVRLIDNVLL